MITRDMIPDEVAREAFRIWFNKNSTWKTVIAAALNAWPGAHMVGDFGLHLPFHRRNKPMEIELGKQYRTRDGREVRVYAVDGGGPYPVHGAVKLDEGWEAGVWRSDGRLSGYTEGDTDLIEVKPRIERKNSTFSYFRHAKRVKGNSDG